ncbi:adenomatous polyposis coli protein [Drosophila grimshawi]|uniref:GH18502 n=1 Tax=Drosophila grimshawi TaxID=7222 RepID=B4JIF2_DROGR|nr:adenomatous polyposis coli protein [Drosophila grimshawi]EDV93033.1 GH18502 [Drosophila grimshawi]
MTLNESDAQKQLELTRNFLELSRNADTCAALRSSDCIQLLVKILHDNDDGASVGGAARKNASQALHNIVDGNQREVKVLRLLDQIHDYSCNFLRTQLQSGGESIADDEERHPLAAMKLLMKASFDEEHRQTMCDLGALKAIPNLVHLDHAVHGPASGREQCNLLRRYALMTLTNLTCGEENNKSLLCGQKQFMEALVAQLDSTATDIDDLLQATASVLRNLSWRADKHLKTIFNELGTVTALALAAMHNRSENTLKAILSALWNLSAHCSTNKAEFCAVDGALAFLVQMLSYEGPSKTLKIVENAGGILRNVSSHIAVCESYRQILRQHNCLAILLLQLKSDNQTVVSNSCGTLWNLSARCPEDQKFLIDHNAIPLLRALVASKHSMVAEGSASALKNLVNYRTALELATSDELPAKELSNDHAGTLPRRYSSMRLSSNPTGSLKKVRPETASSSNSNTLPRKCESRESIYSGKSDSDSTKYSTKSESAFEQRKLSSAPAKTHYDAPAEEQPIDYSMKYSSYSEHKPDKPSFDNSIDLDQPTDFSVRYKERRSAQAAQTLSQSATTEDSSEILLILDETGNSLSPTAPMLAKSASACDLSSDQVERPKTLNLRSNALENLAIDKRTDGDVHTPEPEPGERPINYCEEGTPGCFSRFDSLTSLMDAAAAKQEKPSAVSKPNHTSTTTAAPAPLLPINSNNSSSNNNNGQSTTACQAIDSALETPLMFSRRSSMDSLVNDETIGCDDNGSVISEYSRMQSGVISPSELPDSPTQSMPQSPHRDRKIEQRQQLQQQQEQTPIMNSNTNDLNGNDEQRNYCTEDTPALLSKAGSNSNLSVLSIASTANDQNSNELPRPMPQAPELSEDAISKMRCGGSALPSYLPVTDEMNKYYVEDSPCNFSVISGLSNLTVGSAHVGPVRVPLKPPDLLPRNAELAPKLPPRRSAVHVEAEPRLLPKRSDSLSSLSMDSDDDCNLLSQAIAAGSCRQQPSGASASTSSSLTNTLPKSNGNRRHTSVGAKTDYSSDDSLDDGQSKSLFEQCILSGMHKSNDNLESDRNEPPSDRFVSNQVRQIESMLATVRPSPTRSASGSRQHHRQHHHWV